MPNLLVQIRRNGREEGGLWYLGPMRTASEREKIKRRRKDVAVGFEGGVIGGKKIKDALPPLSPCDGKILFVMSDNTATHWPNKVDLSWTSILIFFFFGHPHLVLLF